MKRFFFALLALSLVTGCGVLQRAAAPKPAQGFRYLELVADDGFDSGAAWRQYESAEGDFFLGARDGVFRIDFRGRRYVWTQREDLRENVVIEADFWQVSAVDHNAFGLACRLDAANSGRGYFFLISGDGYASIRWSDGRSLEPIVGAAPSRHIRRGEERNRLRAVCVEDYLALWINGQFVADARDKRASQGAAGLAGVMNYPGRRLVVEVDNLRIWRAAAGFGDS